MDKDIQPISFNKTDGTLILPKNTTVVTREMIEPYRDSVTKIVMPNGVTSIGDLAFCGCESLTAIEIPSSVTEIGAYAFFRCSGLTSITIPKGVTEIRDGTFRGCKSLTSIEIPSSVTEIREATFTGCTSTAAPVSSERVRSATCDV